MEFVISEHLQYKSIKNFLLLNPFIHFKYTGILYYANDKICSNVVIYDEFITRFYLNKQVLDFPTVFSYKLYPTAEDQGNLEIKVCESKTNYRLFNYIGGVIRFEFGYEYTYNNYSLFDEVLVFNYDNNVAPIQHCNYELTTEGKLIKIHMGDGGIFLYITYDKIRIGIVKNNEFSIGDITDEMVQEVKSLYHNIKSRDGISANLTLEFYPDKMIKKYGITLNNKREGFFYHSDESGGFEVSSFIGDKPHGYYFNSQTEEQGFYENGIKVGFWREEGKLINYNDKDRIFFPLPIFPL